MNRLQQAMKINAAIDHLYATEPHVTEIQQYNAIYSALLDIDELINAAESEQLDEEVELELTPAGEAVVGEYYDYYHEQRDFGNGFVETEVDEAQPAGLDAITSADLDEYPYDYAPNPRPVNIFGDPEPTTAFAGDIADEFSPFSPSVGTFEGTMDSFLNEPVAVDVIYHQDGSRTVQPMRAPAEGTTLDKLLNWQRAPVGERVYMEFQPKYTTSRVVEELFTPCGAD